MLAWRFNNYLKLGQLASGILEKNLPYLIIKIQLATTVSKLCGYTVPVQRKKNVTDPYGFCDRTLRVLPHFSTRRIPAC